MKDMKIVLSKHAKNKINERKIGSSMIEGVVRKPSLLFYDLLSKTIVAIARVEIEEVSTNLLVVYTKENDVIRVITTYPCKDIDKEIKRKEGSRWVKIK